MVWLKRELFLVHRVIVLEVKSVLVLVAPTQIRFGHTDHFSVLLEQGQILSFELVWDVEIGFVGDFLISHEPLGLGLQLVDELVDHFLIQRNRFSHFSPLIKGTNEFVLAKSDRVGSSVGDGDQADLVLVEFDNGGTTHEMPMVW